MLVGARASARGFPTSTSTCLTRASAGDRDETTPLAALPDKGAFTADLSDALAQRRRGPRRALVEGSAARGSRRHDGRRRRSSAPIRATCCSCAATSSTARPRTLTILSSSPRRAWLLRAGAAGAAAVARGRAAVRAGARQHPDAARAADRGPRRRARRREGRARSAARLWRAVRGRRAQPCARSSITCAWMVLPLREVPGAPAQGALAIEVAGATRDLAERARARSRTADLAGRADRSARCSRVRRRLSRGARRDGACRESTDASSASAGARSTGASDDGWSLDRPTGVVPPQARADADLAAARRAAARHAPRRSTSPQPSDGAGFWIARAEALPDSWTVTPDRLVWAAGGTTWRRLAARGVWVHGCADGLGDGEPPRDRHARRAVGVVAPADARAARVRRSRRARDLRRRGIAAGRSAGAHALFLDERRAVSSQARRHAGPTLARRLARQRAGPHVAHALPRALGPDAPAASVWLDYERWHEGRSCAMAVQPSTHRARRGRSCACANPRICAISWRRRRSPSRSSIQPLFVVEGLDGSEPIPGLGDNARLGDDAALDRDRARSRRRRAALPAVRGARVEARARPAASITLGRAVGRDQSSGSATRCTSGWTSACARRPTTATARSSTATGASISAATLDALAADGGRGRRRRRRRRQPERHDGRPHGASARGARRSRPRARADHELQHEVREPVLRAVPRGRRLGAAVRRSPALSDRRAIAARRDRVERPVRERRRRPADGEARHDVARSDSPDRRSDRPSRSAPIRSAASTRPRWRSPRRA